MGDEELTHQEQTGEELDETRRQLRGSSLLLAGRVLALGMNFLVQVLIVRYLSKSGYGAFAYGLSIVVLGETAVTFGLDRAVTRFIPIYEERRRYGEMLGVLVMVVGAIVSLGLAVILLAYGLRGLLAASFVDDRQALTVVLILILLSPIQALDTVLIGMFSVFGRARAIFFRRYVLAPGFRLAVVLLLVVSGSDVVFLATGYVAAGLAGLGIYGFLLVRLIRRHEGLRSIGRAGMRIPVREVLWFTVPLFSSDLVQAALGSIDAVLLGHFRGPEDVAALRAIQPVAKLNQLVLSSFGLLFVPVAARFFARQDDEGVNHLYWQTAIWVAVLSFPIFAVTFALATPLTVLMFGERYAESGILLAILASGYYFHAILGFNGMTLNVYGKVGYVVIINLIALVANIVANLLLIPRYGALGAALGTAGGLVVHNALKQGGLLLGTGVRVFDPRHARVYLTILAATGLLVGLQMSGWSWLPGRVAAVAGVCLGVLLLTRRSLRVADTFPELERYKLVRLLVGGESSR